MIERTAAHECERCDLDHPVFHEKVEFIHGKHIVQRIVERAQVGIYLFFQVAGQKTEAFAGFYSRAGKHDFFHQFIFQCAHGQRYGGVGFTRTGRPEGKNDVVGVDHLDHPFLVAGFGLDRLPVATEQDRISIAAVAINGNTHLERIFSAEQVFHGLNGQFLVFAQVTHHHFEFGFGSLGILFVTGNFHAVSTGRNGCIGKSLAQEV